MNGEQKGYLELILFSLFVGTVGVFVRLIENLDIYSIVFFRALIAFVFLFFITLCRKGIKELSLASPFRTFLVGLLQGITIFLYFGSILNTTISNAVFLLYTAPVFSIFISRVFLKEEIEKETIIGVFIALTGIILMLNPRTFSFGSEKTKGNLMGLGAGFTYSAMTLTAKPLMKKVSSYYVTFWQNLVVCLMFLFFLRPGAFYGLYTNWWQLLVIGILCTGIPFLLFMEGIKKVRTQKILIVTTLEPLVGTLAALLVLKETPSVLAIIGAMLIIYGVYRVTSVKKVRVFK
ncbi:MAG: DMT family transporter [bacterium]